MSVVKGEGQRVPTAQAVEPGNLKGGMYTKGQEHDSRATWYILMRMQVQGPY